MISPLTDQCGIQVIQLGSACSWETELTGSVCVLNMGVMVGREPFPLSPDVWDLRISLHRVPDVERVGRSPSGAALSLQTGRLKKEP